MRLLSYRFQEHPMMANFKTGKNLLIYAVSIFFLLASLFVNSAPAFATQADQVSSSEPVPTEITPCVPDSDNVVTLTISEDDLDQGTSDILFDLKMDMDRLLPARENSESSAEGISAQSSIPSCCTSCPLGCLCKCFSGYCYKFCAL